MTTHNLLTGKFPFRAAVLEELNQPFAIRELNCPDALDVGQVLVHIKYSGICGAQLGEQTGVKGPDKFLPHTVGHEGGGIIVETGPGVRHVKVGDPVVVHWRKGIGIDSVYPKYWCEETQSHIGAGANNTWQEFSIVSENRVTKVPTWLSLDTAALLGCAVTTGLGTVTNEAKLKIGESVVVYGCGGVGLNIVQAASLAGAYPIVAIDLIPEKVAKAITFGATHNAVSFLGTGGADVAFDTTGSPDVIKAAWEIARRVILVAQLSHDRMLPLQTLPMHQGKVILGSDGGGTDPTVDIPRYVRLIQADKLNLRGLITHRCTLDNLNWTLNLIRAGQVGRALIEF